jgi:hypothetical protein
MTNAGIGGRVHITLNPTPPQADVTDSELERILGSPIEIKVPNDYPALYEAFCKGRLLPAGGDLGNQLKYGRQPSISHMPAPTHISLKTTANPNIVPLILAPAVVL